MSIHKNKSYYEKQKIIRSNFKKAEFKRSIFKKAKISKGRKAHKTEKLIRLKTHWTTPRSHRSTHINCLPYFLILTVIGLFECKKRYIGLLRFYENSSFIFLNIRPFKFFDLIRFRYFVTSTFYTFRPSVQS